MSAAPTYDVKIDTPHYHIELSTANLYGYFEHKTYGDTRAGGLWFEMWNHRTVLTDYDGTPTFPREVADALAARQVTVSAEYYDEPPEGVLPEAELWTVLQEFGPLRTVANCGEYGAIKYRIQLWDGTMKLRDLCWTPPGSAEAESALALVRASPIAAAGFFDTHAAAWQQ